jgi:hypothetical protein
VDEALRVHIFDPRDLQRKSMISSSITLCLVRTIRRSCASLRQAEATHQLVC